MQVTFDLFGIPRYAPQQQADLAIAQAEIRKLQQENAFLRKQLAPKPLTAIARQFSSPGEPTGFKLIHVIARSHLFLQRLRSNLCRLRINTRRILDVHYSDRNLFGFLIHIGYETELRSQLSKFNIIVRDGFDPLDLSIIRDHTLVNEPIDCKSGLVDLEDLASYDFVPPYKYYTGRILDHV
ncbi:hypothetical protein G6F46_010841 [Rhizopus delemar]|nr:hypothetical protein G6F54_010424 [Rhizopus delemar]KAG1503482.1 hypothetical protein G6F53_010618 [Rhizopus delemar]KAG1543744.1 hypothetical protein G6F49_011265 [Rhizopus delemar]KAG1579221.1 hypothetical protein G6F48_011323 [Rhizopus delemar]KAG1585994.1 hypothetical protein G6F47_011348 [Rhizopus delemar]